MEQMNQNQMPPLQTQPAPAKPTAGPIVGIIIIIVVLIIGALYFYGAQLNRQPAPPTVAPQTGMNTQTNPLSS